MIDWLCLMATMWPCGTGKGQCLSLSTLFLQAAVLLLPFSLRVPGLSIHQQKFMFWRFDSVGGPSHISDRPFAHNFLAFLNVHTIIFQHDTKYP